MSDYYKLLGLKTTATFEGLRSYKTANPTKELGTNEEDSASFEISAWLEDPTKRFEYDKQHGIITRKADKDNVNGFCLFELMQALSKYMNEIDQLLENAPNDKATIEEISRYKTQLIEAFRTIYDNRDNLAIISDVLQNLAGKAYNSSNIECIKQYPAAQNWFYAVAKWCLTFIANRSENSEKKLEGYRERYPNVFKSKAHVILGEQHMDLHFQDWKVRSKRGGREERPVRPNEPTSPR